VQIGRANDWQSVSAGGGHSCGVRRGSLYCWGRNDDGQLGNGMREASSSPLRVGRETHWRHVSAGRAHTCGILEGELYCWGAGSGFLELPRTPTAVELK